MTSNYLKVGDLNVNFDLFKVSEGPTVSVDISAGPFSTLDGDIMKDGFFYIFQVMDRNLASYISENNLLLDWNGSVEEFYKKNLSNEISRERFDEVFHPQFTPMMDHGNGVYKGRIDFNIASATRDPKYVCYMGHPYIDYHSFMMNAGQSISYRSDIRFVAIGDTTAKKILFNNFSLNTTAQYYQDSTTKQPWAGRYHTMSARDGQSRPIVMSGATHNDRSVVLEPKSIADKRVVDMRTLNKAQNLLSEAGSMSTRFYDRLKKELDQQHEKYWRDNLEIDGKYFSDISITTDETGAASLQFDFNLGSSNSYGAISEYASLPSPFEPGSSSSSLINKFFNIESVRVYRIRVKNNEIQDRARETKFNLNTQTKRASFHSETTPFLFDLDDPQRELVAELKSGEELSATDIPYFIEKNHIRMTNSAVPGLIQFFVKDNTVMHKSSGDYQYYVEIKVKDGSDNFVESKLKAAEDSYSIISEYHDKVMLNNKIKSTDNGEQINLTGLTRQAREASLVLVNLYKDVTGKDLLNNQGIHSVISLVDHQMSGMDGICMVFKIGSLLINHLRDILQDDISIKNPHYTKFNKYTSKFFTVENYFTNETFSVSEKHRDPYCKFIDSSVEDYNAFPVKQASELSDRLEDDSNTVQLEKVGFKGGEEVEVNQPDMTIKDYIEIAGKILSGLETGGTQNVFDTPSKDASVADLFAYHLGRDKGVSIRPINNEQEKVEFTIKQPDFDRLVPTSEMNINNSCFEEEDDNTLQTRKRGFTTSFFGETDVENFYFPYDVIVKLSELSSSEEIVDTDDSNLFEYYFKTLKTANIKVLSGYKMSNGRYLMNRPIWEDLDLSKIENGVEYVCKVEAKKEDIFNLKVFNNYFILRNGTGISRSNINRGLFQNINPVGRRDFNRSELAKLDSISTRFLVEADLPSGAAEQAIRRQPRTTNTTRIMTTPRRNRGSY
jgi:hypothetical protein